MLLTLSAAALLTLAPVDEPLPVEKTQDIKQAGAIFFVEGRVEVARNVKLTNLRHCTIRKEGDDEAVLHVEGELEFKAVTGGRITFRDVWLEVGPDCKELTLSHVEFTGRGGIRPSPKGPGRAKVLLENVRFQGQASMSFEMSEGRINMMSSHSQQRINVKGAPRSDKAGSKLAFVAMGCKGEERGQPIGLLGGVAFEGVKEVLLRNNDIAGSESLFADCVEVDFDGNNARSGKIEFRQSLYGKFKQTDIRNNDFRCERLVFKAPSKDGKAERVKLDFCWFDGRNEEQDIRRSVIEDQDDDPENGVLVTFDKICPRPLKLGGDRE